MLFQMLISTCSSLILADDSSASSNSGSVHSIVHKSDGFVIAPCAPPKFCSAVIKLMAQHMQALGVCTFFIFVKNVYYAFSSIIFFIKFDSKVS